MKHLWEIEHPVSCEQGSYYAAPNRGGHAEFDSWAEFLGEWGGSDDELNLLFRWDWNRPDPTDFDDEDLAFGLPGGTLQLYYMLQRKAANKSVYVTVDLEDEPEIRSFLTRKAEVMRRLWEPLLDEINGEELL